MRLYVPTTLVALADPDGVRPRTAYAVTRDLAAALPGEDLEGQELAALLAAADDSVDLQADHSAGQHRRVVAVAEVAGPARALPGGHPAAVEPPPLVPWARVVSLHVDEAAAENDVAAAALGDAAALERAADRDLLWFDVTEIDALRALAREAVPAAVSIPPAGSADVTRQP